MALLTVLSDVSPVLVEIHKLPKRADDVDVLPRPRDAEFGALVQAVVEYFERLQHVAPILALVIEALVQHVHDFVELGRATWVSEAARRACRDHLPIVCDFGNVGHVGARRAPGIIARGLRDVSG